MKKLIIRIVILGLISSFIYFALALLNDKIFKEPILTSSISFDKKMKFFKNQNIEHVNVLAIGSSMTLNNLNSQILESNYNIEGNFLNLGSWGLQMTDVFSLTQYFVDKYSPKMIIISSSLSDFENEGSYFQIPDKKQLELYFSDYSFRFFLRHIDLNIYLDRELEFKNSGNGNYDYKCLNFDKYGGVFLDIPHDRIDLSRWNRSIIKPKELQYIALKELVQYLNNNNIKLLFVQCPIKINSDTAEEDKKIITGHFKRLNDIFIGSNHSFLNLFDESVYYENEFCDTYHLNKAASERFTSKIVEKSDFSNLFK